MNIKIIHTPLWYGCDNPGTHLAPREFSRQNLPALAEKHGHSVKQISIIPTLPKPEDKFVHPTMKYLHEVTDCCKQLADAVDAGHRGHCFPLVIGGDHALGIGSIAGTARTIPAKDLSVIWIDAHTDINTDETSESHNIHGMPLAACLGLGDKRLFETMDSPVPFLLPENLFYIGSRSIDPGEEEILKKYNIRAIRMEEIRQKGIEACCQELLDAVKTSHIHLSFDVDFMDAAEFTATGLPIPDGPSIAQTHTTLKTLFSDPRVCSADFVEYSPVHDQNREGLAVCVSLLEEIFSSLK